jgi:chromate transport protein ChrA
MLPKRADPVAGAFAGTLVLVAALAPPVLIVWLVLWARRRFNSSRGVK